MFSPQSDNCIPIYTYFYIISSFAAEFEEPKIGISGKGLISVKKKQKKREKVLIFQNSLFLTNGTMIDSHFHNVFIALESILLKCKSILTPAIFENLVHYCG